MDCCFHGRNGSSVRAFTLAELLVSVAIIALLASLLLIAGDKVQQRGRNLKELHAARQLMTAYLAYAANNDGEVLKGYDKDITSVTLANGNSVNGEMVCRYPWRLAPYLGEQVDEIFLLNGTKKPTTGLNPDSFEYRYRVSLNPPLGINAYCIGGYNDGGGQGYFTKDLATRLSQITRPSNFIVFASARMSQGGQAGETPGHFVVQPPKLWRMKWDAKFDRKKPSSNFGNVDPRWEGRALCAFLDGSARLLDEKELQDMRLWSRTASEENDPNYTVPR